MRSRHELKLGRDSNKTDIKGLATMVNKVPSPLTSGSKRVLDRDICPFSILNHSG